MTHGVLDERLKKKGGYGYIVRSGLDLERAPNSVAKTSVDEREVGAQCVELFGQSDLLLIVRAERLSQQVTESANECIRGNGILIHHGRNRVERIEEKVWLQTKTE